MSKLVDTILDDDRWTELDSVAQHACGATLAFLGLDVQAFEISLLGCDDARIAELNEGFRGKDAATNVLSWPSVERAAGVAGQAPALPEVQNGAELGDIAISFDTCLKESTEAGKSFVAHITHLMVHGTLHLLGYDHISDKDAELMEGLEVEILASIGEADPYRV